MFCWLDGVCKGNKAKSVSHKSFRQCGCDPTLQSRKGRIFVHMGLVYEV